MIGRGVNGRFSKRMALLMAVLALGVMAGGVASATHRLCDNETFPNDIWVSQPVNGFGTVAVGVDTTGMIVVCFESTVGQNIRVAYGILPGDPDPSSPGRTVAIRDCSQAPEQPCTSIWGATGVEAQSCGEACVKPTIYTDGNPFFLAPAGVDLQLDDTPTVENGQVICAGVCVNSKKVDLGQAIVYVPNQAPIPIGLCFAVGTGFPSGPCPPII